MTELRLRQRWRHKETGSVGLLVGVSERNGRDVVELAALEVGHGEPCPFQVHPTLVDVSLDPTAALRIPGRFTYDNAKVELPDLERFWELIS